MEPGIGDFGVVATYGNWRDRLAATCIRWGTDAPVNHAFVYVGNGTIVEATPSGARAARADSYDNIQWSTGLLAPSDGRRLAIARAANQFAADHVGYGWLDLVAITFAQHRTGHLIDPTTRLSEQPWWVRRVMSMDTLICSQLVDVAYTMGGVDLFTDGRLPGLVSPGDLWRLLAGARTSAG
jgi:hypothetical protein